MSKQYLKVYDGNKYEQLEIEEILSADGSPTGHYKQTAQEIETNYGILDSEENRKAVIDSIDTVVNSRPSEYFFTLIGKTDGFTKYYTTLDLYAVTNKVSNIGADVIETLASIGNIISYTHNEIDKEVTFNLRTWTGNASRNYIFKSILSDMYKVAE